MRPAAPAPVVDVVPLIENQQYGSAASSIWSMEGWAKKSTMASA
jgi:hypothetical protein